MRAPVPWRGYWAKKQAGHKVKPTPLPRIAPTASKDTLKVTIRPRATNDTGEVIDTGPVADQQRFESRLENAIVVAEQLADPHSLVALTVKALRRAKSDHAGFLAPQSAQILAVRVSIDSADRAMCIMDALIKACERRAWPVSIGSSPPHPTVVRIAEEGVPIRLEERTRRTEPQADPSRPQLDRSDRSSPPSASLRSGLTSRGSVFVPRGPTARGNASKRRSIRS